MHGRSPLAVRIAVFALAASLLATIAEPSGSASATPRKRPDRTWMTSGKVYALARAGDKILIGGEFNKLLPPRGSGKKPIKVMNLAAIDISSGTPVRSWRPRVMGTEAVVRALAVSGGTVYVGGQFDSLAGADVQNMGAVRLSDGTAVAGFAPAISGTIYTLLASPDRLYAGGAFGKVDGVGRLKLAAWDLPSRDLTSEWRPRAVGGSVRDMTFDASGSSIFLGGVQRDGTGWLDLPEGERLEGRCAERCAAYVGDPGRQGGEAAGRMVPRVHGLSTARRFRTGSELRGVVQVRRQCRHPLLATEPRRQRADR